MREIKFRGKRKDNSEWVYGGFTFDSAVAPRITTVNKCGEGLFFHKVIPETVGQYTGLKDKNGEEIYEGDIIKFEDKAPFDRGNHIGDVYIETTRGVIVRPHPIWPHNCEIIGDMYET